MGKAVAVGGLIDLEGRGIRSHAKIRSLRGAFDINFPAQTTTGQSQ
jgi:hypothetical protein